MQFCICKQKIHVVYSESCVFAKRKEIRNQSCLNNALPVKQPDKTCSPSDTMDKPLVYYARYCWVKLKE